MSCEGAGEQTGQGMTKHGGALIGKKLCNEHLWPIVFEDKTNSFPTTYVGMQKC